MFLFGVIVWVEHNHLYYVLCMFWLNLIKLLDSFKFSNFVYVICTEFPHFDLIKKFFFQSIFNTCTFPAHHLNCEIVPNTERNKLVQKKKKKRKLLSMNLDYWKNSVCTNWYSKQHRSNNMQALAYVPIRVLQRHLLLHSHTSI